MSERKKYSLKRRILGLALGIGISTITGAIIKETQRGNQYPYVAPSGVEVSQPAGQAATLSPPAGPVAGVVSPADGNFTVEMPDKPTFKTEPRRMGTFEVVMHYVTAQIGKETFMVVYMTSKKPFLNNNANPDTVFGSMKTEFLKEDGMSLLSESPCSLDSHPGKEFIFFGQTTGKYLVRTFDANGRIYELMFAKEQPYQPNETMTQFLGTAGYKFLSSFHITGPKETVKLYSDAIAPIVSEADHLNVTKELLKRGVEIDKVATAFAGLVSSMGKYMSDEDTRELADIREEGVNMLPEAEQDLLKASYQRIREGIASDSELAYMNKLLTKALLSLPTYKLERLQFLANKGVRRAMDATYGPGKNQH